MKASSLWKTLTQAQRRTWSAWAKSNPVLLDDGNVRRVSGRKAMTMVLPNRVFADDRATPTVVPAAVTWLSGALSLRDAGPFTVNNGFIGFRLESTIEEATKWFVWASAPLPATETEAHRKLRFVQCLAVPALFADDLTPDVGPAYLQVWGSWDGPGEEGEWPQDTFMRKLAAEKQGLEEERQLKAGEVDKVVENRVKGLKADWDKQVATLTSERDTLTSRLTAIQIDQGVIAAATKRGLRPTAIPDITARARLVFKLVNGAPRAFENDGTTVRYGRDGVTPMTLEEWVDAQVADAPHLFESNAGGGAAGNGAGGAAGSGRSVKNPFRKETWNLTEQMKLQKSDPSLAARLKAAE